MARRDDRRRVALAAPAAAAGASIVAVLPLGRVFTPAWMPWAVLAIVTVIIVGVAVRAIGARPGVAFAAQALAWLAISGFAMPPSSLAGGVLPTPATLLDLPAVLATAGDEILYGVIPVATSPSLAFLLVAASGALALVVDALAVGMRLPLTASVPLLAVFAAPQLAVPRGSDLALAVPLAVALLAMLHVSARDRRVRPEQRGRGSGALAAIATGAVAIVLALAIAPRVPFPPSAGGGLAASATRIDTSLALGDDLRSASGTEVVRVRTDADSAPYLRLATLTDFEGDTWAADDPGDIAAQRIPDFPTAPGIAYDSAQVTVDVVALDDDRLPVPFATVATDGMSDGWAMDPVSRIVEAGGSTSRGERYSVTSLVAEPTYEQTQAVGAYTGGASDLAADGVLDRALALDEVPAGVASAIDELGLDPSRPYASLVDLQSWLRSPEFSYSLETPVEDDFDGSGVDAIETFLEVREGYCVHFASTFAVAARAIGAPSRIVVGYLPGTATGAAEDGVREFSVDSGQLHAWPEVFFEGLGWTAFDPTPGVAYAQGDVQPEIEIVPSEQRTDEPEPSEEPEPTVEASERPDVDDGAPGAGAADEGGDALAGVARGLGIALAALLVLCLPALVREGIRAARLGRARGGDTSAAWRELRAIALDAGMRLRDSDSPRAVGDLLAAAGADPAAIQRVVSTIEHDAFARTSPELTDLAEPLRAIARTTSRGGAAHRLMRKALPRSLWARPRLGDREEPG